MDAASGIAGLVSLAAFILHSVQHLQHLCEKIAGVGQLVRDAIQSLETLSHVVTELQQLIKIFPTLGVPTWATTRSYLAVCVQELKDLSAEIQQYHAKNLQPAWRRLLRILSASRASSFLERVQQRSAIHTRYLTFFVSTMGL